MPAESLLVVNVLPENDLAAQPAIQTLKRPAANVQVIHAYPAACGVKTEKEIT